MTYRFARLVPALAGLSAVEVDFILASYGAAHRFSQRQSIGVNFNEIVFVAVIVFAELVGLVAGWVYSPGLWGLIAGSSLALIPALVLSYIIYRAWTLITIHRWLKSEQGRFVLGHSKSYEKFVLDNGASYDI